MLKVKVARAVANAKLPTYAHPGDAGCDLYAAEEVTIAPGERAQVGVGVAFAIPEGYVGLVWDKSGLSQKHGLKTLGGVVDAGFRGEVKVGLVNLSSEPYRIEAGHKVAQMLIQRVEAVTFEEVDALDETSRGLAGFGSTGL